MKDGKVTVRWQEGEVEKGLGMSKEDFPTIDLFRKGWAHLGHMVESEMFADEIWEHRKASFPWLTDADRDR